MLVGDGKAMRETVGIPLRWTTNVEATTIDMSLDDRGDVLAQLTGARIVEAPWTSLDVIETFNHDPACLRWSPYHRADVPPEGALVVLRKPTGNHDDARVEAACQSAWSLNKPR